MTTLEQAERLEQMADDEDLMAQALRHASGHEHSRMQALKLCAIRSEAFRSHAASLRSIVQQAA